MNDQIDSFDELLKSAMIARPEHVPMLDVAAVATTRVRTQQERLARLARIAWWTRLSGVAAGILIAITAAAGYWLWPASTSSTTTADTTSTLTTTSTIDMTTIGIAAFVVTLIAVTMLTLMTPERPTLRLIPI